MKLREKAPERALYDIPIRLIVPNPNQPRKAFAEDELIRLADSINRYGLLQPINVRPIDGYKGGTVYELISGERRLRACKLLCLQTIPCVVSRTDEKTSFELSVVENIIRSDLNMFEQAEALAKMTEYGKISQEIIAEKLSVSQGFIANKLRLLKFAPHERQIIIFAGLSERHARALLRLEDPTERLMVMQKIIDNKLSVAQTEAYINSVIEEKQKAVSGVSCEVPCDTKQIKAFMRDTRIFVNTLERSVSILKASGINVAYEKTENLMGDIVFSISIKS